ncbi:MAG: DUF3843 family protein [Bacteroidales bacterium]|nr:MAG: DUF3843 family protein [Bacteroidales bacterium]
MEIRIDDLKRMLPNPDAGHPTDDYYLMLAQYVDKLWAGMNVLPEVGEGLRKRVALDLVGYFQDVVADAGLWRSFVKMCRHLYGRPVPFYDEPDGYVDAELNQIDVQFIAWYSLESHLGFMGLVSPVDSDLLRLSHQVYRLFAYLYDDAPAASDFKPLQELDLDDREQVRDIFLTSGWLFWNSYFMRPVSKHHYEPEVDENEELSVEETLTDERRLHTTFEQPTGPLALLADEWLRLIVDDRIPATANPHRGGEHEYFTALCRATGGEPIAFCATYDDLERFLSERLGWGDEPGGHFPHLRGHNNFVIYADRHKGMIIAKDIAQYVNHPSNTAFDTTATDAHRLVMEQGVCPVDLLRYLFDNDMVPAARWPSAKTRRYFTTTGTSSLACICKNTIGQIKPKASSDCL